MSDRPTRVGTVAGLWRYPVKSMAAEPLDAADVSWHGLAGDRRWGFVRGDVPRSGFPWLTIRERADMGGYRPRFTDPDRPDRSEVMVRTPSGAEMDVIDPALAGELGRAARAIKLDRGVFDSSPLSLISAQTVAALGDLVDTELDIRRFRPNIVVDAEPGAPFAEDDWVGAELRVGAARIRVDRRDERCVIVNTDPDTGERDPRVLRAIAGRRQACLGVYGAPTLPGPVRVGDAIVLERAL